ncbi:hypothetical protein NTE_00133 [Candidatus Nitrososphaera evergladensis SR1]|jgi:hypothetical protein|uniref:Uncharacterized protein n=1 Tax=Candidatus Nitrososphaera evergladensis SR1 TaxID=1459636 RepID=A0A075MM78_9ARCH|nr:hypothetical protein [Candidatus Nitrososphaera evergladensis]AIF82215.1 hypothetical protein NTE_00133 [Candidatus Nitrososphaera evergladensis SR1]
MRNAQWNGLDSSDTIPSSCPYRVDFECTPAPAESLNSLESGRLMLTVKLQGDENKKGEKEKVKAVAVRLVNKAKRENLGNVEGSSELKRKTSLSANLARDNQHTGWWAGVIGIPITWMEGGTTDYERSGSWHPKSKGNLFAMEITYTLDNGSNCTAHFDSEDAYHWTATR